MSWSPSQSARLLKQGSDSSLSPVFIVPVFSGLTACFDSLLKSLDKYGYRKTVYGLMDPYLTGNDEALTAALEDWIGFYIAAMKTKQPSGPYTLVGYSQGMHWCWAIAEGLKKMGDDTEAIVVLDPNFPAWNGCDRCVKWLGPPMNKVLGIPMFVVKNIMGPAPRLAHCPLATALDTRHSLPARALCVCCRPGLLWRHE